MAVEGRGIGHVTRDAASKWQVIAALGVTQIIGYGSVFYSFSPFMQPLQRALGADKSVVVGAFSLALLAAAACAILVGRTIDRRGGRAVMTTGSAAAGLLLLMLSQVESVRGLYIIYFGLGCAMAAILYEPAFAVITRIFGADARLAITTLTLIAGFASTGFWPLCQLLIDALGWRGAIMALAGMNLLVCVPLHFFAMPAGAHRRTVADSDPRPDKHATNLGQALKAPAYY